MAGIQIIKPDHRIRRCIVPFSSLAARRSGRQSGNINWCDIKDVIESIRVAIADVASASWWAGWQIAAKIIEVRTPIGGTVVLKHEDLSAVGRRIVADAGGRAA